jgi:hypothetical protein
LSLGAGFSQERSDLILTLSSQHFGSTYADLGDRFEELTTPQWMKAVQFANKEPPICEKANVFGR